MKSLMPFCLLILASVGCVAPNRTRVETSSPQSVQPSAPNPTIEYTKPRWETNEVYTMLHFEIKNTSSRNLTFIHIHASFYDANDNLITSQDPYIDRYQNLGVGQRSAATVTTEPDRRIKSVRLEFTCRGIETLSEDSIVATEVPKL